MKQVSLSDILLLALAIAAAVLVVLMSKGIVSW